MANGWAGRQRRDFWDSWARDHGRRKKENHYAGKAVAARTEGWLTENIATM